MAKKEILKPFIRSWEGGYCNVPGDRGGATKWGVTITTYRSVYGQQCSVTDLRNMTEDQWDQIYHKLYWRRWLADQIQSQPIANLLVDWLWHSGQYGIKLPQKILGVHIDGLVGPKTIAAINSYPDQHELFAKLWHEREDYFRRLASRATQKKFLQGWLNRLNGIQYDRLVLNNKKHDVVTW